jgi:RHS repeat-associated protein
MSLAQRRAQVRRDLARPRAVPRRFPARQHLGQAAAARLAAGVARAKLAQQISLAPRAGGPARLTPPVAATGAPPVLAPRSAGTSSPPALSSTPAFVWVDGPSGPVQGIEAFDFIDYPAGFPGDLMTGIAYPGETLTAYADVFNEDDDCTVTSAGQVCPNVYYNVQITWDVLCGLGVDQSYNLNQVVSAPDLYTWAQSGGGGVPGVIVPLTFQLNAQQCGSGSSPSTFFVTASTSIVGVSDSGGALVSDGFEGSLPSTEVHGCPCGPDSAGGVAAREFRGDSVDTGTGEYADSFTDAVLKGPGSPLTVMRSYSSGVSASGPLGPGWTMPWFASLSVDADTGDVIFNSENGSQFTFTGDGGGAFTAPFGARSVLAQLASGDYALTTSARDVLTFSSSGQLLSEVDPTGRGLSLAYSGGQLTAVTDAAGQQVTLSYAGGLLTRVTLPDARFVGYGYAGRLLTSVTVPGGPSGYTTSYGYSPAGLLDSVKDPDGHFTVRNTYNAAGQVTESKDATGAPTAFSYTTASGLDETDTTDPDGGISTDVYGGGVLLATFDPAGGETTYDYDDLLDVIETTDPLGNSTIMTYDGSGYRLTSTDPLGHEQQWTYDADGNATSYTDADEDLTKFTYNAMDEVTSVTSPSGGEASYGYDSSGSLTSSVDPRGNVPGASPAAYTTAYGYNAAGQLTSDTDLGGETSFSYDAEGFLVSATDPMNHLTGYGYDAAEHLTSVTAPDKGVTKYAYDGAGNLISRTDPDNSTWTYYYDADNRLAKATDPLNDSSSYTYDGDGNQVTFTDARRVVTTTAYTADDEPASVTYSDGTPAVAYGYNADGQVTTVTDGTGTRILAYNAAGALTGVAGPGSGSFSYVYDPAGNLTSRSYPDGTQTAYAYDNGQVASMTTGSAVTTYTYDAAGNLVSAARPDGVTESEAYNPSGQLTQLTDAEGSTTLDSYGLTLNPDGEPAQVAVTQDGAAQPTIYDGYDTNGRLASACYSSAGPAACSAAAAGTATGTAPNPSPGAPAGMVTSGIPGKCLDDAGGSTTPGTKIDESACTGAAATQQWTIEPDGTVRLSSLCLDVRADGTANGTLIDLYTCKTSSNGNQQWKAVANQGLENPASGKCLDDPSGSTVNGTQLEIETCANTVAQHWRLPYNGLPYAGELTSGIAGKCLDDAGGSTAPGNKVDESACTGAAATQLWTVEDDGTVRISGRCLDVKGNGTANGTLVDLYTCKTSGGANQHWAPAPYGYLINPASGKCLEDPSGSTANGTQLDIDTCSASADQQWTLPATTVPADPAGVAVMAGAGSAALTWTPPASSGGSPLTGYTITASPGGRSATAGPYATSATVTGLTASIAYTFTVTASNGVGSAATAATTAVTPGNETTWSYDKAGNLTGSQSDGLTTTSTYNADEELTQAVTGPATVSYGYNTDGQQTSAGNLAYSYNAAGELSRAVTPAGTFSYGYDSSGDLAATSLGGSLIQGTTWDINNLLPAAAEDTGPAGATTADYLYDAAGTLASVTGPPGTSYPVTDWLGSVTGLVSSGGAQQTSTTYSPYGIPSTTTLAAGAPASSIGYAGSYALPGGAGLDDMRARDYSPAPAAFTSVDPMVAVSGQPYAYASDTPAYYTDPSGRLFGWDNLAAGLIGAIVGGGGVLLNDLIYGKTIKWSDVGIAAATGFVFGFAADECGPWCGGAASGFTGNLLSQLNDHGWSASGLDYTQLAAETEQGALMGSLDDYLGSGGGAHVADSVDETVKAGLWTMGPDLTAGALDPAAVYLNPQGAICSLLDRGDEGTP